MLTITFRDLWYRRYQFAIAVAGVAVVFALTFCLTGVSTGLVRESQATVESLGADFYVVEKGVSGAFTSHTQIPESLAAVVGRDPGVKEAHPIATFTDDVRLPNSHGSTERINVTGDSIGHLGVPVWGKGTAPDSTGKVIVDDHLNVSTGSTITVGGRLFTVVGKVHGQTYYGGFPTVFMSLRDAQTVGYGGRPVASSIAARGHLVHAIPGYTTVGNAQTERDLRDPVARVTTGIDLIRILVLIAAGLIVGGVTYLSAIDRTRDFAILKAVGASTSLLVASLSIQAAIAGLVGSLVGLGLAFLIAPAFPLQVVITFQAMVVLPMLAVLIALVASLASIHRARAVNPAHAFGV